MEAVGAEQRLIATVDWQEPGALDVGWGGADRGDAGRGVVAAGEGDRIDHGAGMACAHRVQDRKRREIGINPVEAAATCRQWPAAQADGTPGKKPGNDSGEQGGSEQR